MPIQKQSIVFQKTYTESIDSTNMELIRRLEKGKAEEGSLLQTGYQYGGKGQGGTSWESEKGMNLLFSFVLKPAFLEISAQFYISIIVSLALKDVITTYIPEKSQVKIKWPNDIYVGSKKIAGILIENAIQGHQFEWVVVGIGLNVNQQVFQLNTPNPISLIELCDGIADLDEVLYSFEIQIAKRYSQLQLGDFSSLKSDYLNSLFQYREWSNYRSDNIDFRGRILGLDEYGFLRMDTPDGIKCFDIKEVEYF